MVADSDKEIPIADAVESEENGDSESGEETAEVSGEITSPEEELHATKDRLLRLQAEFDNFRKREARERAAAWARAKSDLINKLLPAIDDLERVAEHDAEDTAADSVIDGISLVQRKIIETLGREGLKMVGEPGEPFDPNHHEAIGTLPAPSADENGHVAEVAQRGYLFGAQLLRPAKVHVYQYSSTAKDSGGSA